MNDYKADNGVLYLTAPSFEKLGICHGFSTKEGGVSKGYFSTMNLSFSSGDDKECVMENYRRFAKAVGFELEKTVLTHQVHETKIHKVTEADWGKGILRETDIKNTDGLVTDVKGVALMIFFADCVPLLFADRKKGVIGVAHSGWRGTVGGIGREMISMMVKEYGCQKQDIYVVIGPSICQQCYEVSDDVAEEFQRAFRPEFHADILISKGNGKYLLDLWKANSILLKEAGLRDEQIEIAKVCTCCNSDMLFSHRATAGKRGTMAGVIVQ